MEIRPYREATDRAALHSFNLAVFGSDEQAPAPPDAGDEATPANPYASDPSVTVIAIEDGVIVGHMTSTPFRLWAGGEEQRAWWLGGLHVLPQARRLGLAKKLIACMNAAIPLITGVLVIEPSRKSFLANGWIWPGKIREYVCVLRADRFAALLTAERLEHFLPRGTRRVAELVLRMARTPARWAISAGRTLLRSTTPRAAAARLNARATPQFCEGVDELWRRARGGFGMTQVRSARYLNWQFPSNRGWRKREYLKDDVVQALALYTVRDHTTGPLRGLRALNIVDMFWDPAGPGFAAEVIEDLVTIGRDLEADIVMASGRRAQLNAALRGQGFFRIPGTVFVGFWRSEALGELASLFKNAYITRGYADAAGGLAPA